jgi:hypothetical protein
MSHHDYLQGQHEPDYSEAQETNEMLAAEHECMLDMAEQDAVNAINTLLSHSPQRGLQVFLKIAKTVNNQPFN